MLNRKLIFVLAVNLLVFTLPACNALSPQIEPTQIIEPVSTPFQEELPQTEADVPRVTVEEAKAALDSGEAVIVDVRSAGPYQTSHIAGAIHIPLGEIQANPTGLELDKEQWILTYCT
ncbi:MAG TPA: rhodanese-like domain-containing protein [Anaerolineales bacterium]